MAVVWVEDFIVDAERRGLAPKSVKLYRDLFRTIRNHHGLDLETVGKDRLFQVLDGCRKTGSPSYYFLKVYMIKRALKFLGRKELADSIPNPRLRDRAGSIKVIPLEDVDRLIREASNERDRLLVELLHETGARRGEIASLRVKDVQFDEFGAMKKVLEQVNIRRSMEI